MESSSALGFAVVLLALPIWHIDHKRNVSPIRRITSPVIKDTDVTSWKISPIIINGTGV